MYNSNCSRDPEARGEAMKRSIVRMLGIAADVLMFVIMLLQMLYVFMGNTLHEILGICFFACLVFHLVLKRKWIKALLTGKLRKAGKAQKLAAVITCLLLGCTAVLMFSSMGVSRTIFPWFKLLGSADLHRYLASAVFGLMAVHGCMYGYVRAKRKKRAAVLTVLAGVACVSFGLFGVPYLNRHFRTVDISYAAAVTGEKAEWKGSEPLVVYFTRVGNTDLEPDVDAVSGASLLLADGELMGSNRLLADMLTDILGCEAKAVTVTGKKYPSGYGATVSVAIDELRDKARPEIVPIDVSGYEDIILVYPLWWGTVPPAVSTFLESNDFTGKTVYLIATQGSYGFGSSTEDVKESAPGARVVEVMSIYCDDIPASRDTLLDWVKRR